MRRAAPGDVPGKPQEVKCSRRLHSQLQDRQRQQHGGKAEGRGTSHRGEPGGYSQDEGKRAPQMKCAPDAVASVVAPPGESVAMAARKAAEADPSSAYAASSNILKANVEDTLHYGL